MKTIEGLTKDQQAVNFETMRHIEMVRNLINNVVVELLDRAKKHDQSKLAAPEVELFTEYTERLAGSTFGSQEYEDLKTAIGPALQHHYANNRHHPEFVSKNEEWRDIVGYEDIYQISNLGRVRSLDRTSKRQKTGDLKIKGRTLVPHITPKGYVRIQLSKDGVSKNVFIHTLVIEAFLYARPKDLQINHKNGDKQDNTISNLEYVSASDNLIHAYDNGLKRAPIKYVVTCKELDITTFGTTKMASELVKLGYEKASASAIHRCITSEGDAKHLNLSFTSENIQDRNIINSEINHMNLIDLVEMLCDWRAASTRHNDGNIRKSIEINGTRFQMSPQLIQIFENSVDLVGER
jgi:hypothetical protein